ncbi:anti-sigma factor [Rhizobium halophytocola]|uniref:Anti-sigma-K factor RskA n=1 Tax=Rhizobium halophytocola TaxID=735519 RepID=A0ABS4E066_9HYPH|nr:anti-sigma factor [Rhizobium halophytocola]MBP1851333.1 anti-sigma-K factor RskA [Rhizobium halophytocola]
MTAPGNDREEVFDDEALAGEYVLGVLDLEARQAVERRMRDDRVFRALVSGWEQNLSALDAAYIAETPPARVYNALEARLFAERNAAVAKPGSLWNSLALWRGLAFAGIAAAAVVLALDHLPLPSSGSSSLVAQLSGSDSAISLVAHYDGRTGQLLMTPVATAAEGRKVLEVWLILGDDAPRSLGILPQSGEGRIVIPDRLRRSMGEGAILAVSLEPDGGSPTGLPTGPVLAVGPVSS